MDRYPTVRQPNTVAVNPETGRVYVAGRDGEIQIIDS
jgi:DNA-binding beta-propeller fold protein YncE